MKEETAQKKVKLPVVIFIIASIAFVVPSIIYLVQNKSVYRFSWVWTYLFRFPTTSSERMVNAIMFFALITILFLAYILIEKKHKQIFKNKKS